MIELNTRYTFKNPAGTISDSGITEIRKFISSQSLQSDVWKAVNPDCQYYFLPSLPDNWQWVWVVQKGEYAGTMPKRVSKYYYKALKLRCPETFLQELGNIARKHANDSTEYTFEFVDEFNWSSGDYGDYGACWFHSNSDARQILADAGGMAIRFYNANGAGIARAWVYPTDDMYIVFNGYGLQTITIARIMATWLGMDYKKINLSNWDRSNGTVWINGGMGYLLGTSATIDPINDYDLEIGEEDDDYVCEGCGNGVHEDYVYFAFGDAYCSDCYHEYYADCWHCEETVSRDNITYDAHDHDICESCLNRHYTTCDECDQWYPNEEVHEHAEKWYCTGCYEDLPNDETDEPESE
jgi:hypothetical protein